MYAWNYNTNRNNKQSTTPYKQKQKNLSLPDQQLAENLILVFVLQVKTKNYKNDFVTKSLGIIVMINFM